MKLKFIYSFLLSFIILPLNAETTPHTIQWKGIETWQAGNGSKTVIAFENAQYPDNSLPYFVETVEINDGFSYDVNLVNPTFIPVEPKEEALLTGTFFPSEIKTETIITNGRNKKNMFIKILPFISKEGKILKLKDFGLQIEKKTIQKSKTATNVRTYADNSVLASGKFVKIKIVDSGIYKLTYENLLSMGISPENVRVFGYGGALLSQDLTQPKPDDLPEIPIYMNKGADGVFNAGDYVLFYAKGVVDWKYDFTKGMFTHTLNHYAREGYYFVTSDVGTGRKISDFTPTVPADAVVEDVTDFNDYQLHEKESYSLIKSGKKFYGESFSDVLSYNFSFNFPNTVQTSTTKVRVSAMATSTENSSFNVKLNDSPAQNFIIQKVTSGDYYDIGRDGEAIFNFASASDNAVVNLKYVQPISTAKAYLDFIEVNVHRALKMSGSVMFFRNTQYYATSIYNHFILSGANQNVQIWDITDAANVKKIVTTNNGGNIEFTDSNEQLKQYVAIDPTAAADYPQPASAGVTPNQNLHALRNVDFVILTHPRFLSQAKNLADEHRKRDGFTVEIVTPEQVYNEFSSGTPDATAYRWVMKMLYDRAKISGTPPKYLLLFGRGSFDNRSILPTSSESLVLTYQDDNSTHRVNSYVTDDYFGLLDDNEGVNVMNGALDIGIGRFVTLSEQQAKDVVKKTIGYMENTQKGIWKNQLCFIGDDGGKNEGITHVRQADTIAELIRKFHNSYQINKLYLDAYKQEKTASGDKYPTVRTRLLSLLQTGLFLLNFSGHASENGWTDEQILTAADIRTLYNERLPIWVASTCDFVVCDASTISAGEYVLINPVGGGNSIFAAARTVYASQNERLNKLFTDYLFQKPNGAHYRLGDVVMRSKNDILPEFNKLSYMLLGDPALKLTYPTNYSIKTEKFNNQDIQMNDTLKALSIDSIQGSITDESGNYIPDFNGILDVNIYDKQQKIVTLNNHDDGAYTYLDRPNTLYAGQTHVKNGKFTFKLMVPKDIRYNYGTGRINYYVTDTIIPTREGQGFNESILIGGSSLNYDNETDGPNVSMFLNNKSFRDGDKVNETPMFYAFLNDKNGINTVGSGIGHDLRLIVDNNPFSSYTLNDYYVSNINDYTTGMVKFKIPALDAGKHTLTFQGWDLLNNSTTKSFNFEVVVGLQPTIYGVINYPNPAKEYTNFTISNDRPETVLDVMIEVFDLQGRKIWTQTQNTVNNLTWNLKDAAGKRVQPGIYLYKVSIKTPNSNWTSKANKIIVLKNQ